MSDLPEWLSPFADGIRQTLEQGRLPHAMLLIGREGDGMHVLGRHLGQLMLCTRSDRPCGQCKTCLLLAAGAHPDLKTIEPEGKSETIKVAQVRDIGHFMHETAQQGGNKVIRLIQADRMNTAAANALLKMLEEPTPNTYLLLEAGSLSRLLPTVRSRCRIYKLESPGTDQVAAYLAGEGVPEAEIRQRLAMAQNAPLQAASISSEAIQQWDRQVVTFHQERGFSALASFINQQSPEILLDQLLMWVDGALRQQQGTPFDLPDQDQKLVKDLTSVPAVSLFRFRDYILQLIGSLQHQANLNQQMWSEQLAARWLELTG